MKKNQSNQQNIVSNKISTDGESENDLNCTCEILNDTSLSDVGDSDCSCSQCLEANLDAFNELEELQKSLRSPEAQSLDRRLTESQRKIKKQGDQNIKQYSQTRFGKNSNASLNKKTVPKYRQVIAQQEEAFQGEQSHQDGKSNFTLQNINDYILITKERTRQYLNQRNKIEIQNKKLREQLKNKIKQNLQILKYTVKSIRSKNQKEKDGQRPQFKWNHAPLVSGEVQAIRKEKLECKTKLELRKNQRRKVQTNLDKLVTTFSSNPSQFLQQAKQKRLEKFKECKGCPYDHCPNHHMRTSKRKLQQIENFIKKKVQKYNEKLKKQKQKQEENQKIKKAKLRAIELKSKQALKRSKKYDPSASRTSFHLSIDHFSTFSELRVNKQSKEQQKQQKKEAKNMQKQKEKNLQELIYDDIFSDQQKVQQRIKPAPKKQVPNQEKKQYSKKITKEARIHSPKTIKPGDEAHKKQKKQKKKDSLNPNKQKKKAKQLALEIERKKMQLMEEYKRQNQLKQSKNQKLKKQYLQSLIVSRF